MAAGGGRGHLVSEQPAQDFANAAAQLYLGGVANVTWERAISDLSAADAGRRPAGLPHSAAQIVAHVQFWQHSLLSVIAGKNPPAVAHAAEGLPAGNRRTDIQSTADEWEALKDRFLRDAQRLRDLTLDASLTASPDRKGRPYAVALTNSAGHSVYHLGQVVTVRQALGLWPPVGGGATW